MWNGGGGGTGKREQEGKDQGTEREAEKQCVGWNDDRRGKHNKREGGK